MTHEELMQGFDALYDRMSKSKDVDVMKGFGMVFRESFETIAANHPEAAEAILESLKAATCNNYVCEEEADRIVEKFINFDNSVGPMWSRAEIETFLDNNGYPKKEVGLYNFQALYVAMNMVYSDVGDLLEALATSSNLAEECYEFAMRHLKDKDHPRWIRKYFEL